MNKIIDGKKIASDILENLKNDIVKIGINKIGLAFVLVGEDSASKIYVEMKKKACKKIGVASFDFELPHETEERELLKIIDELNRNKKVHGILIQQPLPSHINPQRIIYAIDPEKDVDGFHPVNIGKMLLGDESCFYSCTPFGIKTLMEQSNISVEKKHVVICGRSNIVGKPLAVLLMQNKKGCNATVTVTHRFTENLAFHTRQADIVISAVGIPNLIKSEMIKDNAIIIDVGQSRIDNKIVGDVDYENVYKKVSRITPVPGGVGPMTIAALLQNTYKSYINKQIHL